MDEFYQVIAQLPPWLFDALNKIPANATANIQEIRLRAHSVPVVTHTGVQTAIHQYFSLAGSAKQNTFEKCTSSTWISAFPTPACTKVYHDKNDNLNQLGQSSRCSPCSNVLNTPLTQAQIEEIFFYLCKGSVHSFQDELSQGFFTLEGGHRVGVGGTYIRSPKGRAHIQSEGQPSWQLQQATSLNIRIARNRLHALPQEISLLLLHRFTSILLIGEPNSGKTTVTRSIVKLLSQQCRSVVVIDERGEFAVDGVDFIHGMEKCAAVQLALRTLSPEVIVLDELGTLSELVSLEQGFFAGVSFVATLHAGSFEEFEHKSQFQYMHSHGMLQMVCLLQGKERPGQICQTKSYITSGRTHQNQS